MFNQPEIAQGNPSPSLFPPYLFGIGTASPRSPRASRAAAVPLYGHTSNPQILNINLFKLKETSDEIHLGLFWAAVMSCFNFCVCSYPAQQSQSPLTHQIRKR